MNACRTIPILAIGVACIALSGRIALAQNLPVVKGKKIVASVNGEPITLDEFNQEIASMKNAKAPGQTVDKQEEQDLLRRLINTRLILQEARNIGLDALPEIKTMVDAFSRETLREELAAKVTRDVKADEREVERIYKESIQEWKISAVLCEKEEDAKSLEAELKAGGDFAELSKKYMTEQRAKRGEDGVYLKVKDVEPQFKKVAAAMAPGSASSIIRTKLGFVILRLDDIRYIENAEEKEEAKRIALISARRDTLKAFNDALQKKYVKLNPEILDGVDYESQTPGFEALLKDSRVVAEIKGEKPVTVGDVTEQLKYQFFHGVDRAAERKRLNARKHVVLDGIVHRRIFRKEALRQGVDKTESYQKTVREYETGVLFDTFVNKVIVPEVKVEEQELRAYYGSHLKEYTTPEMVKLRNLAFRKREDAENATQKLKEGTEIQWLADHAEGQADPNAESVLSFDGRFLTTEDLPEGIRKAIAGGEAGAIRFYASPEGPFYVLAIQGVIPAKPQPYEEAKEGVMKKVFAEKVKKAVEEYADQLKPLSDVKVYLKG